MQSVAWEAAETDQASTRKVARRHLVHAQDDGPSELEEVEAELGSPRRKAAKRSGIGRILSPVLVEAFIMTFLGEWGDRSQITTISLAAAQSPLGVTLGGGLGHIVCTGAAVLGGRSLASVIDPQTVNMVGGVLFVLFGLLALYEGP
jgi:Ca2+/H+ antiporter, TMEM165/GDT1 family